MKLKSLLFLLVAAVLAAALPRQARADDVSFEFFYDSLSPYGEWVEVGDYGYCWHPNDVDDDWAPYSDGYWTYTDAGWTWVSYEDFGGIVYHYGRWVKVEDLGWCWVPDYEWGPAWVSWRRSDDYVGWAPLPVEARWERDRGFSVWVDTTYDIGPGYYSFCRVHDFGAPVLRPVIVRRTENLFIINNTVNITNITFNTGAGCIFNGGLDYGFVSRHARRPIPALKLVRNTDVTYVNHTVIHNNVRVTNFNAVPRGNQLVVLAPRVARPQPQQVATFIQPKVKKVVPQMKVSKGWGSLTADQRESVKAKFARETKGIDPATVRARPVKADDLKVVPVKGDPDAKVAGVPVRPGRPSFDAKATPAPGFATPPATTAKKPATEPATVPPADAKKKGGAFVKMPRATPPVAKGASTPVASPSEKFTRKPVKPVPAVTTAPPTNPPAAVTTDPPPVKRDLKPSRPTITKPFTAPPSATPMLRQRTIQPSTETPQIIPRKKVAEPVENKPPVIRQKPVVPDPSALRQRMQNQQEQQAARARAAEATAARKNMVEQQQQQLQQQQAATARQQAVARSQAAAAARQRTVQPVVPQVPVQRGAVKPGKRVLTPEEEAVLKKTR